jgi:very-short-patch-repair endonuclease
MEDRWVRYNPRLKHTARTLRKNMTLSEILLWQQIKGKRVLGYDFHRQKPIDEYVIDFYCPRLKLVLEIDGDSHDGKEETDRIRQDKLESMGLAVLRFWDSDVKSNVDGIVEQLKEWIETHRTHTRP